MAKIKRSTIGVFAAIWVMLLFILLELAEYLIKIGIDNIIGILLIIDLLIGAVYLLFDFYDTLEEIGLKLKKDQDVLNKKRGEQHGS